MKSANKFRNVLRALIAASCIGGNRNQYLRETGRGEMPVGNDFILLISRDPREKRVQPRWKTLTSISGTTATYRFPPPYAISPATARYNSPTTADFFPHSAIRGGHVTRGGVVVGRNRPRSAPLVNIRPSQPPRNIWPGWPDVSYWRNMARAVKYSRSKLADGDVYLNNYTHTSCRPPFHISTSRSFDVIPYVILVYGVRNPLGRAQAALPFKGVFKR